MRPNMEKSVVIKLDLVGHSLGHLSENSVEAFVDVRQKLECREQKRKGHSDRSSESLPEDRYDNSQDILMRVQMRRNLIVIELELISILLKNLDTFCQRPNQSNKTEFKSMD